MPQYTETQHLQNDFCIIEKLFHANVKHKMPQYTETQHLQNDFSVIEKLFRPNVKLTKCRNIQKLSIFKMISLISRNFFMLM
jgi:hypothetical protein